MSDKKRFDLTPFTVRLAALWVAAGALFKLLAGSPADLPQVLHELPLDVALVFKGAIGIELAIVCAALLRPTLGWLPMVLLFAVFDAVLVPIIASGAESCGCFGSSVTIPPEVMLTIDSVLLLGILLGRPWKSKAASYGPAWLVPALALVCLVLPFPYIGEQKLATPADGEAQDIGGMRWVPIELEGWKDQLIYDTGFATLFPEEVETLPIDGRYVFWRWDCSHCAEHLQVMAEGDPGTEPIVLIRLEQETDNDENRAVLAMPAGGHVTELSLPAGPQYIVETPAEFVLEGGVVVSAREGIKTEDYGG